MMAEIVAYREGMSLGRTFDLQNCNIGRDIFPKECTSKPLIIECPITEIKYSVIKTSRDIGNILDVSAEVSLKILAGIIKAEGMLKYLEEDRFEENTIIILARVHVETLTETLTSQQPIKNWKEMMTGTHYVRSIAYGGDLVVRVRIKGSDTQHLKKMKETFEGKLGGILNITADSDAFEKARDKNYEIDIDCYANGPQKQKPKDFDGIILTLTNFDNDVRLLNNGKGRAIQCELLPLQFLDPDAPRVLQNKGIEIYLREMEEAYEDLMQARAELNRFLQRNNINLLKKHQEEAYMIEIRIQAGNELFYEIISKLKGNSAEAMPDDIVSALGFYFKSKKLGGFRCEVKRFIRSVVTA